jgi:hypothetical protein
LAARSALPPCDYDVFDGDRDVDGLSLDDAKAAFRVEYEASNSCAG